MGLSTGLILTGQLSAEAKGATSPSTNQQSDPNDGNMNYYMMTDEDLLLELDTSGAEMYKKMSPEGKLLARRVASMMCNNTNPCKGLNACKTSKNDCAGKGACKGQGKCAFNDKNLAVKVANDKMAQKRDAVSKP